MSEEPVVVGMSPCSGSAGVADGEEYVRDLDVSEAFDPEMWRRGYEAAYPKAAKGEHDG